MHSHPFNLALRFILEISTLFIIGYWGFKNNDGILKYIMTFGLPLLLAAVWGVFAVSNDPSRSGKTVVETAGSMRLVIELLFFAGGSLALYKLGYTKAAYLFALAVIIHYLVSYERVLWLLRK
ncbi:MAG: YrdB family protein [Bacteroidia bacterium]